MNKQVAFLLGIDLWVLSSGDATGALFCLAQTVCFALALTIIGLRADRMDRQWCTDKLRRRGLVRDGRPYCIACGSTDLDNTGTQDFAGNWQAICMTCHHVWSPIQSDSP